MAIDVDKEHQSSLPIDKAKGTSDDNYYFEEANPYLNSFVSSFDRAEDSRVYSVTPLNEMVPGRKNDPLYMLHTYWAKKPFDAIESFIKHFTREGDLVLDPFLGCGSTALVAGLRGRRVIGSDVSPSAMRIACGYCNDHPFDELREVKTDLLARIWDEVGWLFQLNGKYIRSIVISEKFRCVKCFRTLPIAELGIEEQAESCPHCGDPVNTRTLSYVTDSAAPFMVDIQDSPLAHRASESFIVGKSRTLDGSLATLYERISAAPEDDLPHERKIPQRLIDLGGRLLSSGIRFTPQLHSKRQRLILSGIRRVIASGKFSTSARRSLEFVFSAILLNSSQMYRARKKGGIAGAYYVPPIRREINTYRAFAEKYEELLGVEARYPPEGIDGRILLSRQSAADLSQVPGNTVDYIFTDPPYADTMPFAALNAIYDYWFNVDPSYAAYEAIGDDWGTVMSGFFKEAYRVLKPGHWLSLCYHDTSEGTWAKVQDLAAEAGLISEVVNDAVGIDANQKAYQQTVGDKVTKRDLVINFRKPRANENIGSTVILGTEDETTFGEKVRSIIGDYLSANPGTTKDRIYDEVVSRMVRSGRMESHNFEELLGQVAEEVRQPARRSLLGGEDPSVLGTQEVVQWYLRETEMAIVDSAESVKEDSAAASVRSFISQYLTRNRGVEGVHYSDIFEHFVYAVKDKPRRPLADWLVDYLFKTDQGTYRLPASEEEEQLKKEGRAAGTNRRIKRYLSYLQQGLMVPAKERPNDSTLAEWITSAKRSGLYEAGKLLYEKGGLNVDSLSADVMVNVEEDYQVCVRMLARANDQPRVKKTKKKRTT